MKPMTSEELTRLDSRELLTKLDEIRAHAQELGIQWVDKKRVAEELKELMPSYLAEIQLIHLVDVGVNEARAMALADPSYKKKKLDMVNAEHEANLVEVEYKAWMKSLDSLTAISYVRNNELKNLR